ncbi:MULTISPECIES: Crp/Fnr family transcriptional regulator [unclassified Brevundimonas]|uniref:Crp/Fnr family transcriptional regulator n=1 Tax=unclassified Brevundimonas TaxID=2622653 RepID=UPI0025C5074D|nr:MULTISPECIES: Crp/Fnr family transcriptional regulator [unclassified Brevundimonas]
MKNQSDTGPEARLTAPLELMLASFAPVGVEGRDLIRRSFTGAPQHQPSGAAVLMDPERDQARLVASGWIARGAMLNDGRRQIIGLSLPGDVIVASGSVDADLLVWALTDVVTVDATAFWNTLSEPGAQASSLSEAWRRCRTAERLRMARQVVRLGRLNAYERTAHLLLEMHERQVRLGTAHGGALHLPLTQDVLADILGLSTVHMNRTLQQLRRDVLVDYRTGRTLLQDLPGLVQAANLSAVCGPLIPSAV